MPTPVENHDLEGFFACGHANPSGMHLVFEGGAGEVRAETRIDPAWPSWRGLAHGGLIATMMDEALGWAVASIGHTALTARLEVRYLLPVRPGQRLQVLARVLRRDRRLAHAEAEVRLPDGRPIASAHATMVFADTLPPPAEA